MTFRGLPLKLSEKMANSAKASLLHYVQVPHVRAQEDQALLAKYPAKELVNSFVLLDRPLGVGEWLKLPTTDLDFRIRTLGESSNIAARKGVSAPILLLEKGDYEKGDVENKIVVLYGAFQETRVAPQTPAHEIVARCLKVVLTAALECLEHGAQALICVLPEGLRLELFKRTDEIASLSDFCYGVTDYDHAIHLRDHVAKVIFFHPLVLRCFLCNIIRGFRFVFLQYILPPPPRYISAGLSYVTTFRI